MLFKYIARIKRGARLDSAQYWHKSLQFADEFVTVPTKLDKNLDPVLECG